MAEFEQTIFPNNNFLLEFVLPLLEAKRAEKLVDLTTNQACVKLGFNIHIRQNEPRAVSMNHDGDKLRFYYSSKPRLSETVKKEKGSRPKYETRWTLPQRDEFLECFGRRFPDATLPTLEPKARPPQQEQQNGKQDEDDDDDEDREPVPEFANLKIVGSGRLEMDSNPSSM